MEAYTPPVDRLVPVLAAFGMMGMRTTNGYAKLKNGSLKAVRNGRRTFIRASEIERYINALEAASEKEAA